VTCHPLRSADGKLSGFVCSRGQPREKCSVCGRFGAELLCDYPLKGKHDGKTCDRLLCRQCATNVPAKKPKPVAGIGLPTGEFHTYSTAADTYDLCPAHARLEKRET